MKRSSFACSVSGMVAFFLLLIFPSMVWAETRSLKIYYIHTREKAEIAYKKDGRYLEAGLKKLNHMLRDWRRNEPTNMDPRLFDLIWQVYKLSGSRDYIHVVSAYRSPATNNMLRSRSANSGVAKNSQHTLGKALDFYLPDVNLAKLRGLGLKQEAGGVGYYPTSGSPFIHMDVGSVRHWPRMNRKDLMALFPDGKTIHVPSDGKPLERYNQALAAYNARKGAPPAIVVAREEKTKNKAEKKPLFAGLFGGKKKTQPEKPVSSQTQLAQAQPVAASAAPISEPVIAPDTPVLLPEDNVPIPAFSPLKQSREERREERQDAIAEILVAESDARSAPVPEMGFVPIPVMKAPSLRPAATSMPGQTTEAPTQIAQIPSLSRSPLPPLPEVEGDGKAEESEASLASVIATTQDIVPQPDEPRLVRLSVRESLASDGRQDFASLRQDPSPDLPEIDGDMIRSLIAEAMIVIEADAQVVASIPRTTPKADKPGFDELGELIALDEAQRLAEASLSTEEIRQIPELVFVSGLQKGKKAPVIATLHGRAINFPPVARISTGE